MSSATATAEVPAESSAKPVRGRPFVSGDPRVPQNRPPAPPPPPRVDPPASTNPVLSAYRAVMLNHPKRDLPGLEEAAREVLRKDKKGFLAKYEEMERREAESAAESREKVAAAVVERRVEAVEDAGADRVVEAIERVLVDAATEVDRA